MSTAAPLKLLLGLLRGVRRGNFQDLKTFERLLKEHYRSPLGDMAKISHVEGHLQGSLRDWARKGRRRGQYDVQDSMYDAVANPVDRGGTRGWGETGPWSDELSDIQLQAVDDLVEMSRKAYRDTINRILEGLAQ